MYTCFEYLTIGAHIFVVSSDFKCLRGRLYCEFSNIFIRRTDLLVCCRKEWSILLKAAEIELIGARTQMLKKLQHRKTLPNAFNMMSAADPEGGARGPCPPVPVKTSHKKDGHHMRCLINHVSYHPSPRSDHPGPDAGCIYMYIGADLSTQMCSWYRKLQI